MGKPSVFLLQGARRTTETQTRRLGAVPVPVCSEKSGLLLKHDHVFLLTKARRIAGQIGERVSNEMLMNDRDPVEDNHSGVVWLRIGSETGIREA